MGLERKLIDYLPPYMQDYKEMQIILTCEQEELDLLWGALDDAYQQQFLDTAREYGISRRERILGITPKGSVTLDERKFEVQVRENTMLPYTIEMLNKRLLTLCGAGGYSLEMQHEIQTLNIKIALTAKENLASVTELIGRIAPANTITHVTLKYNQHKTVGKYTNKKLRTFTHSQLRDEVI